MTTVNLRTGEQREPSRDDYATKRGGADPGGECPRWLQFLGEITGQDTELQAYLQRVAGYCLTGITTEHVMFFCFGLGANGKSIFLNTLAGAWGDYAVTAPMATFLASRHENHPTDLAMLRGARLVIAQEIEPGRRWAESKIKSLTGGDPISARYMRQDFFTFQPQFKLLIAGNHKPSFKGIDEAIRRRIHLIPFNITIPPAQRDPRLFDKLRSEWGGILQWATTGCLEWQRIGLAPPPAVRQATDDYLASEDAIAQWLDERCEIGPRNVAQRTALFQSWKSWAEAAGEWTGTQKDLYEALENRKFVQFREPGVGTRKFRGLALQAVEGLL